MNFVEDVAGYVLITAMSHLPLFVQYIRSVEIQISSGAFSLILSYSPDALGVGQLGVLSYN